MQKLLKRKEMRFCTKQRSPEEFENKGNGTSGKWKNENGK